MPTNLPDGWTCPALVMPRPPMRLMNLFVVALWSVLGLAVTLTAAFATGSAIIPALLAAG
jgi:hypothetical protein